MAKRQKKVKLSKRIVALDPLDKLADRRRKVLKMLCEGMKVKEITEALGNQVTTRTIDKDIKYLKETLTPPETQKRLAEDIPKYQIMLDDVIKTLWKKFHHDEEGLTRHEMQFFIRSIHALQRLFPKNFSAFDGGGESEKKAEDDMSTFLDGEEIVDAEIVPMPDSGASGSTS